MEDSGSDLALDEICAILGRLRDSKGLTDQELADRIGYKKSQVNAIRHGKIAEPPPDEKVEAWIRVCASNADAAKWTLEEVRELSATFERQRDLEKAAGVQGRNRTSRRVKTIVESGTNADSTSAAAATGVGQTVAGLRTAVGTESAARGTGGREPGRPRALWSEPPRVPSQYIERPDIVNAAADLLTASPGASIVGLVGMGGAGKSTAAKALVADRRVRESFPDGVVWIDVGPDPDLRLCLGRIRAAFGDTAPSLGVAADAERLRQMLRGFRCLLVLDDVWDAAHIRVFLLDGHSRVLVTSRSRDALLFGAAEMQVGPLDPQTGRSVLACYAGTNPASLPDEAEEIWARCGGLVLALALAGGMVSDGHGWANVADLLRRADLTALRNRFADYDASDLLAALAASVTALPAGQRDRYLELAVFEGNGGVPLEVVRELWRGTATIDHYEADDLVVRLSRRSLIICDPTGETMTLHDLLFAYTRETTSERVLARAHRALSMRLIDRWGGIPEALPVARERRAAMNPADHYTLAFLVRHLLAAGADDLLNPLLAAEWTHDHGEPNAPSVPARYANSTDASEQRKTATSTSTVTPAVPCTAGAARSLEATGTPGDVGSPYRIGLAGAANAWFALHDAADLTTEYLTAIRFVWRHAAPPGDPLGRSGDQVSGLATEIRCALIVGSIASVAANIPPSLLARLVSERLWTPRRALTYAMNTPGNQERAIALASLAPLLPADLLPAAARSAAALNDLYLRALALAGLAPHLGAPERDAALNTLVHALENTSDPLETYAALRELAAVAPPRLMPALLKATAATESNYRAEAFRGIAPHLPEELLCDALDTVLATEDTYSLALALTYLAPRLPEALLARAYEATLEIQDAFDRALAFAGLLPHLPEGLHGRAATAALESFNAFTDPDLRGPALADLAPNLPGDLVSAAFQDARSIMAPDKRAEAMEGLAHRLNPEQLAVALDDARSIHEPEVQVRILAAVAPHVPEREGRELLVRALKLISTIDDSESKHWHTPAHALRSLVPRLPADLIEGALGVARAISFPFARAYAIGEMAPYLSARLQATALDAIAQIDDGWDRAQALSLLAPHLPPSLIPVALDVARGVNDHGRIPEMLTLLARYLPAANRGAVVARARRAAQALASPDQKAAALTKIAQLLSGEERRSVLSEVLASVRATTEPFRQRDLFRALAPLLPAELFAEALSIVRSIPDDGHSGAAVMEALAPVLPTTLLPDALDVAQAMARQSAWSRSLACLLPRLTDADRAVVLDQALRRIRDIWSPMERATTLATLAPHLPAPLLPAVLSMLADVRSPYARALVLTSLTRRHPTEFGRVALDAAREIGDPERKALALLDLASYLAKELRREALESALTAGHAAGRQNRWVSTLASRAALLPPDLLPAAVAAAAGLHDDYQRANALIALVPHLDESTRRPALGAAYGIASSTYRARALTGMAHYLSPTERSQTVTAAEKAARQIRDGESRAAALTALLPLLPVTQHKSVHAARRGVYAAALDAARTVMYPSSRGNMLLRIAEALDEKMLMADDRWSAKALLEAAAETDRTAVVSLLPVVLWRSSPQTVIAAVEALDDVRRWWP